MTWLQLHRGPLIRWLIGAPIGAVVFGFLGDLLFRIPAVGLWGNSIIFGAAGAVIFGMVAERIRGDVALQVVLSFVKVAVGMAIAAGVYIVLSHVFHHD
jgi:hypothetical protein